MKSGELIRIFASMSMKRIAALPVLLMIIVMMTQGCRRDEPTTWNIHGAGPLAQGRIGLDDLLADSLLTSGEDNLWHLILKKDLTDFDLDSLVAIPDTTISRKFSIPLNGGPWNIPAGVNLIAITEDRQLGITGAELKEIHTSGGFLEYEVRSYVNGYLTCTYSLPGLTRNGQPTVISAFTPPLDGAVPGSASGVIDLSGYEFDLTGTSGFARNSVASSIVVSTSSDAPGPAVVYGNDSVVVRLRFLDPEVAYARGYFGQHHYTISESPQFFTGWNPEGFLALDQAEVRFRVENYTGADAQVQFTQLSSVNGFSGNQVDLSQGDWFETINITRATEINGIITPVVVERLVNSSNSNINAFIENLPNGLTMVGTVDVNPLGDISDGNDFIYTSKAIRAMIEADFPLRIGMNNLVLRDTLALRIDEGELDASGEVFVHIENHFPFATELDVWLLDAGREPVRKLADHQEVEHAIVTSDPSAPVPASSVLRVALNSDDLEVLRDDAFIVLRVEVNTPGYPSEVGIYTTHYMDVKVVADIRATISIE